MSGFRSVLTLRRSAASYVSIASRSSSFSLSKRSIVALPAMLSSFAMFCLSLLLTMLSVFAC